MNELPSGTVLWSLISGDLIGDFSELTNLEGLKSLESCCYISNKKVLMGLWQCFTRLTQGYPHSFPMYLQHINCIAIFLLLKKLWRIFLYSKGQCLILFCVFTILDFEVIFFFGHHDAPCLCSEHSLQLPFLEEENILLFLLT